MSKEAAIAAALDALDGSDDISWTGMGVALDAALPHLAESYGVVDDREDWTSSLGAAQEQAAMLNERDHTTAYRVVAVIPVEKP